MGSFCGGQVTYPESKDPHGSQAFRLAREITLLFDGKQVLIVHSFLWPLGGHGLTMLLDRPFDSRACFGQVLRVHYGRKSNSGVVVQKERLSYCRDL
jgi:hypothetical protein